MKLCPYEAHRRPRTFLRRKRRRPRRRTGLPSSEHVSKLCPRPHRVIESEDASGYNIKWGNGRVRKYSYTGGCHDRVSENDGKLGTIFSVHTYI